MNLYTLGLNLWFESLAENLQGVSSGSNRWVASSTSIRVTSKYFWHFEYTLPETNNSAPFQKNGDLELTRCVWHHFRILFVSGDVKASSAEVWLWLGRGKWAFAQTLGKNLHCNPRISYKWPTLHNSGVLHRSITSWWFQPIWKY